MADSRDLLPGIEKLDGYNYNTWKTDITLHLKYKGL